MVRLNMKVIKSDVDEMPHLEDCSDVDIAYPVKRVCSKCTIQRG